MGPAGPCLGVKRVNSVSDGVRSPVSGQGRGGGGFRRAWAGCRTGGRRSFRRAWGWPRTGRRMAPDGVDRPAWRGLGPSERCPGDCSDQSEGWPRARVHEYGRHARSSTRAWRESSASPAARAPTAKGKGGRTVNIRREGRRSTPAIESTGSQPASKDGAE